MHRPVDPSGQVHAEERERRVGHGIDQPVDEVGGGRTQLEVLTPERDDPCRWIDSEGRSDEVRLEPGAVHQHAGQEVTPVGPDAMDARDARRAEEPGVGADLSTARSQVGRELTGDRSVVGDSGLGHVQRCDAAEVRFDLRCLPRVEPPDGEAVGPSPGLELRQAVELLGAGGRDQLAGELDGDPVCPCEVLDGTSAGTAEACLHRSRPVVDAGVDDAAVVPTLVAGDGRLLLQDHDTSVWIGVEQ